MMIYFFIIAVLIILDQVTKYFAVNYLKGNESKVLIDKFLELTYVENRGAAFGILQGRSIFFIIITITVCSFIVYYMLKNYHTTSTLMKLSLSFVVAGAIGNLIDRIIREYVVDFIFVRFWGYYDFPVFNVADICVVVGAVLIMLIVIFDKDAGKK